MTPWTLFCPLIFSLAACDPSAKLPSIETNPALLKAIVVYDVQPKKHRDMGVLLTAMLNTPGAEVHIKIECGDFYLRYPIYVRYANAHIEFCPTSRVTIDLDEFEPAGFFIWAGSSLSMDGKG